MWFISWHASEVSVWLATSRLYLATAYGWCQTRGSWNTKRPYKALCNRVWILCFTCVSHKRGHSSFSILLTMTECRRTRLSPCWRQVLMFSRCEGAVTAEILQYLIKFVLWLIRISICWPKDGNTGEKVTHLPQSLLSLKKRPSPAKLCGYFEKNLCSFSFLEFVSHFKQQ